MPNVPTLLRSTPPSRNTLTQEIATNVRRELGAAGIRGSDVMRMFGWSRPRFSNMWHGRKINLADLERVAELVGCDPWALCKPQ